MVEEIKREIIINKKDRKIICKSFLHFTGYMFFYCLFLGYSTRFCLTSKIPYIYLFIIPFIIIGYSLTNKWKHKAQLILINYIIEGKE